jgi:hypothetical protein
VPSPVRQRCTVSRGTEPDTRIQRERREIDTAKGEIKRDLCPAAPGQQIGVVCFVSLRSTWSQIAGGWSQRPTARQGKAWRRRRERDQGVVRPFVNHSACARGALAPCVALRQTERFAMHYPGHVREAFVRAIDAFIEWHPDKPEPIIELERQYVPYPIPFSALCRKLWRCSDILPGMAVKELLYAGLEMRSRTYAAAAQAMLAHLNEHKTIDS